MNKEQKTQFIDELKDRVAQFDNLYITDASSLTVEDVNKLRRLCFERGVQFEVVKNTLLKKALETYGEKYEGLFEILHGHTSVMLCESSTEPARVIKKFRKDADKERPVLKGAYIGEAIFIGDDQLEAISNMKSREELIGEIIGLLQSPAKNVISALQSSGGKLAGILKTLSEKEEN